MVDTMVLTSRRHAQSQSPRAMATPPRRRALRNGAPPRRVRGWIPLLLLGILVAGAGAASAYFIEGSYGTTWARSTDGNTWNWQSAWGTSSMYAVAYGNGKYIAVGSCTAYSSPDGSTWTYLNTNWCGTYWNVAYGRDASGNGLWVAVGSGGMIRTSTDGISWTQQGAGLTSQFLRGVAYGNGHWAVVGDNGVALTTSAAPGGWTVANSGTTQSLYDVAYGGSPGTFVAVGTVNIKLSADGASWTDATSGIPSATLYAVAFGGGSWVAVSPSAGYSVTSSDNGANWVAAGPGLPYSVVDVTYSGARWIAAGSGGIQYTTNPTGTWTTATTDSTYGFHGVTMGFDRLVAVGVLGSPESSPDGITWYNFNSGSNNYYVPWSGAAYGNGVWVLASQSYGYIVTSTDGGVSWAQRNSGTASGFSGVAYGNGWYVAVGNCNIRRSNDAVTWVAPLVTPCSPFTAVAYGNGVFVAVGGTTTATAPVIYVSTDNGNSWTAQTGGATGINYLTGVAYGQNGAGQGLWVAVGYGGQIITSPATSWNWAPQVSGVAGQLWAVTYAANTWLAVGAPPPGGGASAAVWSSNGASWTSTNPGSTAVLRGVAHDGTAFVAVGDAGSVRRSTGGPSWVWSAPSVGTTLPLYTVAAGPAPPVIPPVVCSGPGGSVPAGVPATFTASGGGPNPSYTWWAPGSDSPGPVVSPSLTATWPTPGSYTVTVSNGVFPPLYGTCAVTVASPPALACAPSQGSVMEGDAASFAATGGAGGYNWSTTASSNNGPYLGTPFTTTWASSTGSPFTVTVRDAVGTVATCSQTVLPRPAAVADAILVMHDALYSAPACPAGTPATSGGPYAGVLCNDQDTANRAVQAVLVAGPTHLLPGGSFALAANGGFSYRPADGYCGPPGDSFQYRLHDVAANSDLNTVTAVLTIACPGPDPGAVPDAYVLNEDCSATAALSCAVPLSASAPPACAAPAGVLCNDSNNVNHALQAVLLSGPTHGTLLRSDGTGPAPALSADGSFRYTPDPNWCGTDAFTYRIHDVTTGLDADSAAATFTIACIADPPVAPPRAYTIVKDSPLALLNPSVTGASYEPDAAASSSPPAWATYGLTSITPPSSGGQAVILGSNVRYAPPPGFVGTETFTYTLTDGIGLSATGTVTLQVKPDRAPVAQFVASPGTASIGQPVAFLDASTDPDPDDHVASWSWTFGDFSASSAAAPMHAYGASGTVMACLVVTDSFGMPSAPTCHNLQVLPEGTPSVPQAPAQPPQTEETPPAPPTQPTTPPQPTAPPPQPPTDGTGDQGSGKTQPPVPVIVLTGPDAQGRFTLDASSTASPSGAPLAFAWLQVGGPAVPADGQSTNRLLVAPPEGAASLRFVLAVSDGSASATAFQDVLVPASGAPQGSGGGNGAEGLGNGEDLGASGGQASGAQDAARDEPAVAAATPAAAMPGWVWLAAGLLLLVAVVAIGARLALRRNQPPAEP